MISTTMADIMHHINSKTHSKNLRYLNRLVDKIWVWDFLDFSIGGFTLIILGVLYSSKGFAEEDSYLLESFVCY